MVRRTKQQLEFDALKKELLLGKITPAWFRRYFCLSLHAALPENPIFDVEVLAEIRSNIGWIKAHDPTLDDEDELEGFEDSSKSD